MVQEDPTIAETLKLSDGRTNDKMSVWVPTKIEVVKDILNVPDTPSADRHNTPLSDSHEVAAKVEKPMLHEGEYLSEPSPDPKTVRVLEASKKFEAERTLTTETEYETP